MLTHRQWKASCVNLRLSRHGHLVVRIDRLSIRWWLERLFSNFFEGAVSKN
nr:MAG TPA: hypothetical protein [Caudoviricetes sp.]